MDQSWTDQGVSKFWKETIKYVFVENIEEKTFWIDS